MDALKAFLPAPSFSKIKQWIDELDVQVKITNPRKTKLGDFKGVNNALYISVNINLNPYSFLITLTHELAHAFVYVRYKSGVAPHGTQWQDTFKAMMLNFLTPTIFPEDILKVLSLHLKNPKASTLTDVNLASVLKKYDTNKVLTISDINQGQIFSISNGKICKYK
jgi:hypothetical protein